MNYLAHALLAGPQPASRLGGMLGDFVKGPLDSLAPHFPPDVLAGIALHRSIDTYADGHAAFRASRQRVSTLRRRFSGVMVDMFSMTIFSRGCGPTTAPNRWKHLPRKPTPC